MTENNDTSYTVSSAAYILKQLALSSNIFAMGIPSTGTVNNATANSSITQIYIPSGLSIDSISRTWSWNGYGNLSDLGNSVVSLNETLNGAKNSPNISAITIKIDFGPYQFDNSVGKMDSNILSMDKDILIA